MRSFKAVSKLELFHLNISLGLDPSEERLRSLAYILLPHNDHTSGYKNVYLMS